MFKNKIGQYSRILKFIYLKTRCRDDVESLTTLEEGEFKMPIDGCIERTCVLMFYYFLCLKANLDLEKTNQLGESSPNFIFAVVNLDPIIFGKR